MKIYLDLVRRVLEEGTPVPSVQGVDCLRLTKAPTIEFAFADGDPVITSRSLSASFKSIIVELEWIMSGSCWLSDLHKHNVHFWDKWDSPYTRSEPQWERPEDFVGPIYGHQLRNFGATRNPDGSYQNDGYDQLTEVVRLLKVRAYDRRIRTTTFNPKDAYHSFIIPCWGEFHFLASNGKLWVKNVQRSCDLMVGGAFDLVTHTTFFKMVAQVTGHEAEGFTWVPEDLHIYLVQPAKLLDLAWPTGKLDVFGEPEWEIDDRVHRWAERPDRTLEELYEIKSRLPENQQQGNRLKEYLEREPRPRPTIAIHPEVMRLEDFRVEDVIIKGYHPHPPIKDIPVLL